MLSLGWTDERTNERTNPNGWMETAFEICFSLIFIFHSNSANISIYINGLCFVFFFDFIQIKWFRVFCFYIFCFFFYLVVASFLLISVAWHVVAQIETTVFQFRFRSLHNYSCARHCLFNELNGDFNFDVHVESDITRKITSATRATRHTQTYSHTKKAVRGKNKVFSLDIHFN